MKQLKEILMLNRVDFKGCCEKTELLERVKRLWNELHSCPGKLLEFLTWACLKCLKFQLLINYQRMIYVKFVWMHQSNVLYWNAVIWQHVRAAEKYSANVLFVDNT